MAGPRRTHTHTTQFFSVAIVLLGVVILVRTIVAGGSVFSYGIIIGLLFIVAGVGRLFIARRIG